MNDEDWRKEYNELYDGNCLFNNSRYEWFLLGILTGIIIVLIILK